MKFKDELYASLELAHQRLLVEREAEFYSQERLTSARLRVKARQEEILLEYSPEELGKNEAVRFAKISTLIRDQTEEVRLCEAEANRARFGRENAEITWQYARKRIDLYGMGEV